MQCNAFDNCQQWSTASSFWKCFKYNPKVENDNDWWQYVILEICLKKVHPPIIIIIIIIMIKIWAQVYVTSMLRSRFTIYIILWDALEIRGSIQYMLSVIHINGTVIHLHINHWFLTGIDINIFTIVFLHEKLNISVWFWAFFLDKNYWEIDQIIELYCPFQIECGYRL